CPTCCPAGGGPPPGGPGRGPSCGPLAGMATYGLQQSSANLGVTDVPLTYVPAVGPSVSFRLTYSQRASLQPLALSSYGNVGWMWNVDWLSFVIDDPTHPAWSATVALRGGGAEHYFDQA